MTPIAAAPKYLTGQTQAKFWVSILWKSEWRCVLWVCEMTLPTSLDYGVLILFYFCICWPNHNLLLQNPIAYTFSCNFIRLFLIMFEPWVKQTHGSILSHWSSLESSKRSMASWVERRRGKGGRFGAQMPIPYWGETLQPTLLSELSFLALLFSPLCVLFYVAIWINIHS